jgi:chorismate mutase
MGLITGLLGLPLAPVRGTIAVAEQVLRAAEEEYYDPARIREQIEEVDRLRRTGEIDDDEAIAREDALVERLLEGQQRRGER